MTHVATFRDWADAEMHKTIGARDRMPPEEDVFRGPNPYSTISLRDEVGVHCKSKLPKFEKRNLFVENIWWMDSDELPEAIRKNCDKFERYGLIAKVSISRDERVAFTEFLDNADLRVVMKPTFEPESPQIIGIGFDRGCYWGYEDHVLIFLPFGQSDRKHFESGKDYVFTPRNNADGFAWTSKSLKISRNSN
jgi:hypothetical protein